MKCEEYQRLIEEYADGTLDEKAADRATSHIAQCADCAYFYKELAREQEMYARYQRDVEVTPAIWTAIESRIREERAKRPSGIISLLREQFAGAFAAPRLSPAFATVLVMIAIGLTVFVMSRLNSAPTQNQATTTKNPPTSNTQPPPAVATQKHPDTPPVENKEETSSKPRIAARRPKQPSTAALTPAQLVQQAEEKYLAAIAILSRDVNKRRSQLDPMMLARFDASLAEIDRTIKETRQVVKGNPDDPIALQYLLAAYSKKVDVLREMSNNTSDTNN